MRNPSLFVRSLAGVSLLGAVACHPTRTTPHVEVRSPVVAPQVATLRLPDLGVPVDTPSIEAAPPSAAIAEQVEPAPNELVKQARAALDENDLDRALSLAKQAVLETPARSAAWNTLGRVQLRRGEHDAALDSFDRAVDTNPSSAWARNNYGLALIYAARYDEAVDALEEATDLLPECGLMWNNLGQAYEHVDRFEEARNAYKRAMNLDHAGAAQNFVRLEGVHSLRNTAQADTTPPSSGDDDEVDRGL